MRFEKTEVDGTASSWMSKATTGENCLFRNACEYEGAFTFCGSVNSFPALYLPGGPETDVCKLVYQGMTRQDYIEGLFGRNLYRYPGPV